VKPAAKISEFVLEQCRLDLPLNVVVFMQSVVAALGEQVSALSSFNQMADDNKELLLMTTKDTTMIADAYLQRLSQPPKAASVVYRNSGSTTKNTMHVVFKAEQRRLASRITNAYSLQVRGRNRSLLYEERKGSNLSLPVQKVFSPELCFLYRLCKTNRLKSLTQLHLLDEGTRLWSLARKIVVPSLVYGGAAEHIPLIRLNVNSLKLHYPLTGKGHHVLVLLCPHVLTSSCSCTRVRSANPLTYRVRSS
jgi:hypothetical protein